MTIFYKTIEIVHKCLIKSNKFKPCEISEIIILLRVILKQNYFTFNNEYFSQEERLLADIYINPRRKKSMGIVWKKYGKSIGKVWEIVWEKYGKSMGLERFPYYSHTFKNAIDLS